MRLALLLGALSAEAAFHPIPVGPPSQRSALLPAGSTVGLWRAGGVCSVQALANDDSVDRPRRRDKAKETIKRASSGWAPLSHDSAHCQGAMPICKMLSSYCCTCRRLVEWLGVKTGEIRSSLNAEATWPISDDPFSVTGQWTKSSSFNESQEPVDEEHPAPATGVDNEEAAPKVGKIRMSALQMHGRVAGMVWLRAVANNLERKQQEEEEQEQHMYELYEERINRKHAIVMEGYTDEIVSQYAGERRRVPDASSRPQPSAPA